MAGEAEAAHRDQLPEAPEPVHPRTPDTESDDELEATELRDVSASAGATIVRASRILSPAKDKGHWYDPLYKFWRHHIRITVPHDDCRDHLGEHLWTDKKKVSHC